MRHHHHHHSSKKELEKTIVVLKEEISRLHNELLQTKTDLKMERMRSMDLTMALQEKETELSRLCSDFNSHMEEITTQLLVLERDFRQEQKQIQLAVNDKDELINKLAEELRQNEISRNKQEKQIQLLRTQHEQELKVRDKRIASQWREMDLLKNANNKFLEGLSQLRPAMDGATKLQRNASTGSIQGTGRTRSTSRGDLLTGTKPRRALSPNPRRKHSSNPEWKQELSAFF